MYLVTGATGFAGGRIMETLVAQFGAAQVCGTGRNAAAIAKWSKHGVKILPGDLSDATFCKRLVEGKSTIIHVAARSAPWGDYDSFYQDNVLATQHLLEKARQAGVERFIYISTPSIYFNFQDRFGAREDEPINYQFANNYTLTKYEAEQLVLDSGNNSDMFTLSIRPRAIIGRGDTVLMPRVLKAYQQAKLKMIETGKIWQISLPQKIFAGQFYWGYKPKNQACKGQVFNITDGDPQPIWDTIRYILRELGHSDEFGSVPYPAAYTAAWLSEVYHKIFKPETEPALTCYGVGILKYNLTLNIEKAQHLLGYSPAVSTRQSLDEYVRWAKGGVA